MEFVGSGAYAPVLTVAGLGANIKGGTMIFDYNGLDYAGNAYSNADPAATIAGLLQASYVAGGATPFSSSASRIYSSTADAAHGLGWMDNGSNVSVMYTLYGDTDLNGTVNGGDLNTVLSNFNQTGMTWAQGDFNYDGTVNGTDLNTVLSNFDQHLSVTGAVPEPSSLLLSAAGLAGLLAYAWRKRK